MLNPDFGDKEFAGVGFPTPVSIPMETVCRTLQIPADGSWQAVVMGALLELTHEWNWQQLEGGITRAEAAQRAQVMIDDAYALLETGQCGVDVPTPFWDEGSGDDSDDTAPAEMQPWYGQLVLIDDRLTFVENIGIYLIAGFIAYAGQPSAAVSFIPFARNFVVTFRSNPLGGLIKFFADGQQIGQVDTYSASDGVVSAPISMPAPAMGFVAEDVTYPTLWVELGDEVLHGQPSVSMTLIRSRLSEADFAPTNQRWNSDCDCVQYSPDGGITWVDATEFDPRHSNPFRLPARTGVDIRCKCAASMVKWLKDFLDYETTVLCAGATLTAVVNVVLNAIDLLFPGAVLLQLLLDIADVIFGVGCTALTAAFTSAEYDDLLCIFYCNMAENGSINATQLARIETQVSAQLNTTAALIVNAILGAQGEVGLSNAGTLYDVSDDCSACVCQWEGCVDFTLTDGGFSVYTSGANTYGEWISGVGWRSSYFPSPAYNNVQDVIIGRSFTEVTLTEIQWYVTYLNNTSPQAYLFSDFPPTELVASSLVWSGDEGWNGIAMNANEELCTSTQYVIITKLRMRGYGTRPEFLSDC